MGVPIKNTPETKKFNNCAESWSNRPDEAPNKELLERHFEKFFPLFRLFPTLFSNPPPYFFQTIGRVHLTGHSHCSKKSISVQNRENSVNILGEAQLVGRVFKPDVLWESQLIPQGLTCSRPKPLSACNSLFFFSLAPTDLAFVQIIWYI